MCSIVGFYRLDGARVDPRHLRERLSDALACVAARGPDERQTIDVGARCTMAANRLAIRGELRGARLITQDSGLTVAYNGEIYNHERWAPADRWDGACIAPAYREAGVAAFAELDGEFAIAVHDARREALVIVRDPFGCRPLYFAIDDGVLCWGSHEDAVNALLDHPPCAPIVDEATYPYTMTVQEPYTSYRGVWALPPGHVLEVTPRSITCEPYATLAESRHATGDFAGLAELEDALTARLSADHTIAVTLSAGIDSGIIAFTAERLGIPYHVFSVTSMFGRATPETESILRRCERLRHAKEITLVDCDEAAATSALEAVYGTGYYATERYDTSIIPTHAVYAAIKRAGLRVAVDGAGGDELFHGYPFRDRFGPIEGWPVRWRNQYFYSLHSTLLAFTSKTERAGGAHSVEARFPFQSRRVFAAAARLQPARALKWPLRRYLLENCDYGSPLRPDYSEKHGFGLLNRDKADVVRTLERQWERRRFARAERQRARRFPFAIGSRSSLTAEAVAAV
jgi:asparagine synthase (glutamine-hydrolysing)